MDWKKFLSLKHHLLTPLQHYQMSVVLLFALGFFIMVPYLVWLEDYGLDQNIWQWYFFIPWIVFYIVYNLKQRNKIMPDEQINPLKRPIMHWIFLGLSILAIELQPTRLTDKPIKSIGLYFIIFTLFVADGYWDFVKKRLFRKK